MAETTTIARDPLADEPRTTRRLLVVVLVVVGSVVVLLANLAVWAKAFAYDTDEFVAALSPLADDKEVVDSVAEELTDRVMSLQGGDNKELRSLVDSTLREVLESPAFRTIFNEAVRVAHDQFVEFAGGDRDQAVLDLDDVLVRVDSILQGAGRDILSGQQIEKIDDIVVKTRGRLDTALTTVDWVEQGAIVLPIVALTLFGGAVALSPNRRRTIAQIGLGVVIAMLVTFLLIWLGRIEATDRVQGVYERAIEHVWNGVAKSLKEQTSWVLVLGAVVAASAWIVGRVTSRGEAAET